MDWRRYGMSQSSGALPQGPLVIMVHMASVWVPFTSESKEAIADYDEIRQEIRLGLQECGRKLGSYLNKRRKQKYEGERRSIFERYIGEVVNACAAIKEIDKDDLNSRLLSIATRMTARADEELDEHGKAVKPAKRPETEFGPNTVVVDRDAEPAGELFAKAQTPAEPEPKVQRKTTRRRKQK
jgi:DNA topoisomerase-6 subunit B